MANNRQATSPQEEGALGTDRGDQTKSIIDTLDAKSYDQRQQYCKEIRGFIEDLKNTEHPDQEQKDRYHTYIRQTKQYFSGIIYLPNTARKYFESLSEAEYAHIDNEIANLRQELTAAFHGV